MQVLPMGIKPSTFFTSPSHPRLDPVTPSTLSKWGWPGGHGESVEGGLRSWGRVVWRRNMEGYRGCAHAVPEA